MKKQEIIRHIISQRVFALDVSILLRKCLNQGFPLKTISLACQISQSTLEKIANDEPYSIEDEGYKKHTYLHIFLLQLYVTSPLDNRFFPSIIETLSETFYMPKDVIANYIGISVEQLEKCLLSDAESNQQREVELKMMHLFTTLIRDSRFST